MSRSIDLFIDSDQPPDEVAAALGRLLGSNLMEDPETGAWLLSHGDLQADLTEHRYADDGDLPFTRFRYSLSARVANTIRPQDAPATLLLRQIADLAQRRLGWPVLLVMDLQYRDQPDDPSGSSNGPGDVPMAPGGVDVAPDGVEVAPDGVEVATGGVEVAPGGVKVAPGGVEVAPGDPERATGAGDGR